MLTPIQINGQSGKIGLNVTGGVGIVPPFFNEGSGGVFGIHPLFHQWETTSIEGMISFSNIDKTEISLLGKDREYKIKNVNFLLGLRQLINSSESKNKFFVNLLGGISREVQISLKNEKDIYIASAYSLGFYYERNPLLIGVGIESPDIFFVRFGFVLF